MLLPIIIVCSTEATSIPKGKNIEVYFSEYYFQTLPDGTNLMLAQRHYQARVRELRDLIVEEEVKFK